MPNSRRGVALRSSLFLGVLLIGCAVPGANPQLYQSGDGPFDGNSGSAVHSIPFPNASGKKQFVENGIVLRLKPGEEPVTLVGIDLHSPQNLSLLGVVLLKNSFLMRHEDFFVPFPPARLPTYDVRGAVITAEAPVYVLLNVETGGAGLGSHKGIEITFERAGRRSIAIASQMVLRICEGQAACESSTSNTAGG